ncbi:hypothetical protein ANCCAN_23743 [Ancylostoma caninum]|uniref:Uncharacterized protein n=1 Tax=Ancylostoma caninum TaxID=29170 RepID=A0A368FHX2_ANCCA|nr:hypothetical protein ANCCAN_23743 [Ancylostoma caninum]
MKIHENTARQPVTRECRMFPIMMTCLSSACNERSRSISPETPPRARRVLTRVASLPAGVARGKVGEFVAKHERGIPNPAVGRDRPVRIVRQYAMVDKGT